ncbi:MAG: hypothetical protein R2857_08140 [Vampirovibrionales bacterium]
MISFEADDEVIFRGNLGRIILYNLTGQADQENNYLHTIANTDLNALYIRDKAEFTNRLECMSRFYTLKGQPDKAAQFQALHEQFISGFTQHLSSPTTFDSNSDQQPATPEPPALQ